MITTVSHAELLRLVKYDPETGIITRKIRTSNRVRVGEKVGFPGANGYLHANIGGTRAYVHQFAWLYMTGIWPDHDIDHKNRGTQDNRWANLRAASASQNLANKKRPSNNTSGFKGVHPKRGKWCAQIKREGKCITLGVFDTPRQAHAAYVKAAENLFGEFARAA